MHRELPVRIGLLLADEWLLASRLLRDGQQRVAYAAIARQGQPALAAALSQVLAELIPAGDAAEAAPLELGLVNLRPLGRWQRQDLPQVALLAPAGLEDALHASLSAPRAADCDTARELQSAAFPWVGDALDLFPDASLLDLCPRSHVVPVPLRQSADGQIIQALTDGGLATLASSLQALAVPAAALVLLHSPRQPQPEHELARLLSRAGLPGLPALHVLPSAAQLDLHRGGGDERLRTRAAILSAALAPAASADLQGLRAGLSPGRAARWLLLRGDGSFAPAEQVPPWQQLLAPVAAGLLGAARTAAQAGVSGRFLCLLRDASAGAESPESAPPLFPATAALGALCSVEPPGRPAVHAALCLGIPCELPAVSAELGAGLAAVQRMAAAHGVRPALPADVDEPAVATGAATTALALLQPRWTDALIVGVLRARASAERIVPMFCEASGAQQSGLISARLQQQLDAILAAAPSAEHSHGTGLGAVDAEWSAELRYVGQAGMLSLRGIGTGGPAGSAASDLVVRFVAEHGRVYGFSLPECPVELVQLRLRVPL